MATGKTKSKGKAAEAEAPDTLTRIRVGGPDDIFEIDIDDLTIDETVEIERYLDAPIGEVFGGKWAESMQLTAVLAYLAKRRQEPQTRFEDVRALKLDDLEVLGDRPTQTAG